jgi:hypothetical protein
MRIVHKLAGRRRLLQGMLNGAAVTVGLPFLDCFLNTNGTALAATGKELPPVFGTWFWGMGLTPGRWEPKTIGAGYDLPPEIKHLATFKDRINVFSGLRLFTDGKAFNPHGSGAIAMMTGDVPREKGISDQLPSLDNILADTIGRSTRFRSLEMSATGDPKDCYSYRGGQTINAAEVSPAALYTRIFGSEFVDPNAANFKPDPKVMLRKSALSSVVEQRNELMNQVGAADRARLDEYFTSVRQLEQQLAFQLQKPAPMKACAIPPKLDETAVGMEAEQVKQNHLLFGKLMAQALACGQTQVFSMVFTNASSGLRRAGDTATHHILTHEESVDPQLGYQKKATAFLEDIIIAFSDFLMVLNSVREGDRTLLDRTLVYATSEGGYAKLHSLENIPVFTAGSGGGRIKTGMHVPLKGDPAARVGLTIQQAFGLPVSKWGTDSNQTSRSVVEMLA